MMKVPVVEPKLRVSDDLGGVDIGVDVLCGIAKILRVDNL